MKASCTINLTHHELLELLAIVRIHKEVALSTRDTIEADCLDSFISDLLQFHVDANGVSFNADKSTCFGLWLCVDDYKKFCEATNQQGELALANSISTKLAK